MKESFNSCVSFEDLEKEQIYLHILNQKNYHLLSEIILFNQVMDYWEWKKSVQSD